MSKLSNYGEGSKPREIITSSNGELACLQARNLETLGSIPSPTATRWHKIFAGVYFCGLVIFLCSAGTSFLQLGQLGFSCWELIFAIFRKYPVLRIDNIFVFN